LGDPREGDPRGRFRPSFTHSDLALGGRRDLRVVTLPCADCRFCNGLSPRLLVMCPMRGPRKGMHRLGVAIPWHHVENMVDCCVAHNIVVGCCCSRCCLCLGCLSHCPLRPALPALIKHCAQRTACTSKAANEVGRSTGGCHTPSKGSTVIHMRPLESQPE
jgi:hypothetical protein